MTSKMPKCTKCGGMLDWRRDSFGVWVSCFICGKAWYDETVIKRPSQDREHHRDAAPGGYKPQRPARDLAQG